MIRAVGGNVRHAFVFRIDAGFLQKLGNLLRRQLRAGQVRGIVSAFSVLAVAVVAFIRLEALFPFRSEGTLPAAGGGTAGGRGGPCWSLGINRRVKRRGQEGRCQKSTLEYA